MSDELKEIIKYLEEDSMKFSEAVSDDSISCFEKENSIVLPQRFKEWLHYSDGGDLYLPAGCQIYGVKHQPTIDVNDNDRPSDEYIVIGSLSSGDPVLFKKGSEEIVIYNHEAEVIEDDERYSDYFVFLKGLKELLGIEE